MVAASSKSSKKPVAKKAPVKFVPPTVEEGTWQDTIVKSGVLKSKAEAGDKKAGQLLWAGAQEGINDWLPNSGEDASGEGLYQTLLTLLGKSRKGDASKIKTVAVAVKESGLILSSYSSLSQAYGEAKRLTDAVPAQAKEDDAAEALTEAINESAPKSTSSIEGAAKILLGQGVDEASRVLVSSIIDAAGDYDKAEPVLRSFLRSLSQEVTGRKPKPEPKVKAPAKPKGETVKKATAKPAASKAKPAATKAKPKPAPVEADLTEDEDDYLSEDAVVQDGLDSDLSDLLDDEVDADTEVETPEVPVKTKAKPVVRRR